MNNRRKGKSSKTRQREEMEFEYENSPVVKPTMHEKSYSIKTKFKNEKQKDLYSSILENRITFVKGSAGTGKTMISLMAALHCFKDDSININKIVLTKPYIQVLNGSGNSSTGFLKGTLAEKIEPYFDSFYSNLHKLIGKAYVNILKEKFFIEDKLINFIRGATFGEYDADGKPVGWFVILDEAQNTSVSELKTFLSRMGENTKLVILGDSDQMDVKFKSNEINGLDDAFKRFENIDGIKFIEFNESDIVRDKFLIEIMKRYKM
jgi:phosphate starvation-inducible PhoH-like protein